MYWFGSDADGYVDYFKIQVNDDPIGITKSNDSVFTFVIDAGLDLADILIKVSAVDHQGLEDHSCSIVGSLKNAAPSCRIDADDLQPDSAKIVLTLRWDADDIDGDETIIEAQVRCNNGTWSSIDLGQGLLGFTLNPNGTSARVYQNGFLVDTALDGALADDENVMYLRVKDWAGSYSEVDTSSTFYWSVNQQICLCLTASRHT